MKDVIIIGAGAIGAAVARALSAYNLDVLILERESDVGEVTSSANSAIVHSGYDPEPGSLKAIMNVRGNELYEQMCRDLDIEFKRIGSLTIATTDEEVQTVRKLEQRAAQNGVPIEMLDGSQTLALEPNLTPEVKLALLAPTAGIVNTFELSIAMVENAMDNGVELHLNEEVRHVRKISGSELGYEVETGQGVYQTKTIVNAAGLFSDVVNNWVNPNRQYEILPRKGEYFVLDHFDPDFVKHTIFTVPSSKGKGILVSPTTHGNYILGPSSEFVQRKDDYATDADTLQKVLQTALKLVPSIPLKEIIRQFAGLRAFEKDGHFVIEEALTGFINLVGIQSPGLTSCPAIAEKTVELLSARLPMTKKDNYNPRRRPVIRLNKMTDDQRAEFVAKNPTFGNIVCRCEIVSEGEVCDAIRRNCGATTIRGVKRRVRPGFGKCQGGFCQPRIIEILKSCELRVASCENAKRSGEPNGVSPRNENGSNEFTQSCGSTLSQLATRNSQLKKSLATRNTSYDLIILGGGSAGLAAAISAREAGVEKILILEKEPYLGGILLQCIHNGFGLHRFKEELTGPEYADRFVRKLEELNIEYRVKTMAIKLSVRDDGLKEVHFSSSADGYQIAVAPAIISATGCSERTRGAIRIPGDRPAGVMTAGLAQQYLNISGYFHGKRAFILGSGDIGLIMARRLTLEGCDVLGVAELMPYSNGLNRNIVQCLQDFNIPLYLSHTVKEIHGNKQLKDIVVSQVDEKFQFVPGTDRTFEVDTLLLSVGLIPSNPLLTEAGVALHPKTGGPLVDENLQTSIPGIFSCGNSLHVHDLVDFVSMEGETAGHAAADYLSQIMASRAMLAPGNNQNDSFDVIETKPGSGIGYILPSKILCERNDTSLTTEHTELHGNTRNNIRVTPCISVNSVVNKSGCSPLASLPSVTLKFRVSKPVKKSAVVIKLNGREIKRVPKLYMVPAEMENIPVAKSLFNAESGTLSVEVEVAND